MTAHNKEKTPFLHFCIEFYDQERNFGQTCTFFITLPGSNRLTYAMVFRRNFQFFANVFCHDSIAPNLVLHYLTSVTSFVWQSFQLRHLPRQQ